MKKLSDEVIRDLQDDAVLLLHGETEEIKWAATTAVLDAEAGSWASAYAHLKIIEDALVKCMNVTRPWGVQEELDYVQADEC